MNRCKWIGCKNRVKEAGNSCYYHARIEEKRKMPKTEDVDYKVMFQQAIRALAAIDDALGMPQDGCNSTEKTLAKIKAMREQNERCEKLARSVMADHAGHDR